MRKGKNNRNFKYRKKPNYYKIGSTVYTNVTAGRGSKEAYLCEARVIRHPNFVGGPYKLLICGIQLRDEFAEIPQGILGLRLRRSDDAIIRTLNAFTRIQGEHWVRLDDNESDRLLKQAIGFIKKERRIKEAYRKSWSNGKPRK